MDLSDFVHQGDTFSYLFIFFPVLVFYSLSRKIFACICEMQLLNNINKFVKYENNCIDTSLQWKFSFFPLYIHMMRLKLLYLIDCSITIQFCKILYTVSAFDDDFTHAFKGLFQNREASTRSNTNSKWLNSCYKRVITDRSLLYLKIENKNQNRSKANSLVIKSARVQTNCWSQVMNLQA